MIDAGKLFGSPLADRERWDARRKAAFEAGVSPLPPDASAVLLASRTPPSGWKNACPESPTFNRYGKTSTKRPQ